VDTEFGKIGVAICYDVRFPELARLMTAQGAKLLIYPAAFNMTTGPMHWELLFRSRAVDQQVFTVGCAPARQYDSSYISYGNSMIVSPWGDIMGRLNDEEGYLLGEIDFEEVAHVRTQLPVITQLRKDLYELKLLKESL
jgi:predicted amidohydrolase